MPAPRVTLPKVVAAKIKTQLSKANNKEAAILFSGAQRTVTSNGDTLLWEPSQELRQALVNILKREEGFMRKKGSCNHKAMVATIAALEG